MGGSRLMSVRCGESPRLKSVVNGLPGVEVPVAGKVREMEARVLHRGFFWVSSDAYYVWTPMKRTIQVRISRGEHQFVAECLDLPVVTQAPTLDELTENIREAIGLHLDGEDLAALGFSTNPTILATLELDAVA